MRGQWSEMAEESRAALHQVPVSPGALVRRINRALADQGERLKTTRGDRWRGDLGDYYVVDLNLNAIVGQHVDLEEFGRELKVLAPGERLAEQ
jgi:hypothetical protein